MVGTTWNFPRKRSKTKAGRGKGGGGGENGRFGQGVSNRGDKGGGGRFKSLRAPLSICTLSLLRTSCYPQTREETPTIKRVAAAGRISAREFGDDRYLGDDFF